jgi:hypothetical protein
MRGACRVLAGQHFAKDFALSAGVELCSALRPHPAEDLEAFHGFNTVKTIAIGFWITILTNRRVTA